MCSDMSTDAPNRHSTGEYPQPTGGYEFPTAPDDLVPVATVPTAPPAWERSHFEAPAVAAPVPQFAAPMPPVPAAVDEVTSDDVTAMLGFNPDAIEVAPRPEPPATPIQPVPGAEPYVAPAPRRAPASVPVAAPAQSWVPPSTPAPALSLGGATPPAPPTGDAPAGYLPERPEIERLLVGLVTAGGSDLHLAHNDQPRYRVSGALLPVSGEPVVSSDDVDRMLKEIASPSQWEAFSASGDVDFAYAMVEDKGAPMTVRFRVNAFRSLDSSGAVFRVIPTQIVSLDDLGIPEQVKRLADAPRGLILFTGPTGSGKSTSMAGLVDLINSTRDVRIFTLEDPVEFTHRSKRALVSHREIGVDTANFTEGLRRVRRQDPNVILVGEMRDHETIAAAIEAADTGHLVIATLHTNSAPETISRIINSFPAERQEQIRITLSSTLLAVIAQQLVPSLTSRGRVVATEIMMVNAAIANNIRENDVPSIVNALTDQKGGSISMDAHLARLIGEKKILEREAMKKASSPENLARQLGKERK